KAFDLVADGDDDLGCIGSRDIREGWPQLISAANHQIVHVADRGRVNVDHNLIVSWPRFGRLGKSQRPDPFEALAEHSAHGRLTTGMTQPWLLRCAHVADHLEASLAIEALDMALIARNPKPGLIHHSDRGVQYACADYGEKLEARGIRISMSRAGNPYDNAKAERFMRTLKEEEVNGKTYASIDEARTDIGAFLENVYNRGRLHSALGYKPPVEFEAELRQLETV